MARNRDPFTLALTSLRERIQSSDLTGGSPIIVQDEANRLRLSTTPVREALALLSGEGLVERAGSGGYVTLRLDAAVLRDLYAMQGEYLHFASRLNLDALKTETVPAPTWDETAPVAATANLFAFVVCSAGNPVLWDGFIRVSRRLECARRHESRVFADLAGEASALFAAYRGGLPSPFLDASNRFHQRRVRAVGALAALIHEKEGLAP